MVFNDFNLNNDLIKGIESVGYTAPTPIQESIITQVMDGHDIFAQAPTGTGKTAAFAIPLLNNVATNNGQAFVLCPTRELVNQTAREFIKLGRYINGLKVVEILGSVPYGKQINDLRNKPQIIVATPGRFLDHIKKNNVDLRNIKTIVLDEVDEMFNMGFKRDVTTIVGTVRHPHQTILLSATMSEDAQQASNKFQNNPIIFKNAGDEKKTNTLIEQFFVLVNQSKKLDAIEKIIKDNNYKLTIIFSNTKHTAKWLKTKLSERGIKIDAIHSMLKQNARKRVMDNFRSGQLEALIGTDIIARGIDVKNIDAVINYDIPQSSELYVHRIGRTGRSGAVGKSYLLIGKNEIGKISRLASITKSKIDELKIPGLEYDASMKNETESHRNETSSRYGDDAIRLFMNIGTKDGFDRASLTKYINDHSDLIPTDILDMYLNETYGFITIKKDKQPMLQTITNINGRDVKFDVSNPRKSHRAFNNRPSRSGYNKGGFSRHRNNDNRRGGFNNNEKRRTYDNSNRPTTKFNRYKNDSFRGK